VVLFNEVDTCDVRSVERNEQMIAVVVVTVMRRANEF